MSGEKTRTVSQRSSVSPTSDDLTHPVMEEFGPPPELSKRYRVDGPLGSGGVGVVYRGWDEELARPVAIKFLRPDKPGRQQDRSLGLGVRLRRESVALAALSHPNVVSVFDVVESEDGIGIVMELIEGEDLRTWLRSAKHPRHEVLRVFIEAGRGLLAAHHAGVVHRDFKPANVMVGVDGRVRVLDFGLAQFGADESGNLAVSQRRGPLPLDSDVSVRTNAGLVMGTPAYMAPEQMWGGTVDSRSDQFSFCVSLFEALEGKRPFDGASLKQRLRAIQSGPPAATTTSRRTRAALSRGLAFKSDQRHLSMGDLLEALEAEVRPESKRWVVIGAAALSAVGLTAVWMTRAAGEAGCADADPLEVSWTEPDRARVESAFRATGAPFSADSRRKTESAIDDYVAKWGRQRDLSCVAATSSRHECLADVRARFDAVLEVLESADADVVAHALTMIVGLPEPELCETHTTNRERDPILAASQARVIALQHADRYPAALVESRRLLKAAVAREDADYEAMAHLLLGESHAHLAGYEDALESHQDAYFVALRVGDHDTAAEAAIGAASAAGMGLRRRDEGLEWLQHARKQIDRLPDPVERSAHAAGVEGTILMLAGDHEDGVARLEEAVALFTRCCGEEDLETVNALNNLGIGYHEVGRDEEALAHHERARALFVSSLGPDHPLVAGADQAVANVLATLGRAEEAVRTYRAVITALEKSLPSDHPRVAMVYYNIGHVEQEEGNLEAALEVYLEASARLERSVGRDHVNTAMVVHNIGGIYHDMGQLERAQQYLERSLTIFETSQIDPVYLAVNRFELATVLHDRELDPERVAQLLGASRQVLDRSPAFGDVVGDWLKENRP